MMKKIHTAAVNNNDKSFSGQNAYRFCNISIPQTVVLALILIVVWGVIFPMQARVVKVGAYHNSPKMIITESGAVSGIFADIIDQIASEEGWQIEYIKGTWDEGLSRLQSGEIDIMPDMAFTTTRAALYDFHREPVLYSWSQIYAHKGLSITSFQDLDGMRIAVLKGSIQETTLRNMMAGFGFNSQIIPASSFDDAFELVRSDQADVAVTNTYFGNLKARMYNLDDTPVVFEPSTLFFASKKGRNTDLLERIDFHLKEQKSTPLSPYYQTIRLWTSETPKYRLPRWIVLTVIGIILVLILSTVVTFIFKHQLALRTRELRLINHEMELRIVKRTEELAAAMEKAQAADQLKSAFLATMSHELRTPLNSIIGFTGILLQELPGKLNEEQTKQLRIVQTSARHLLALINDVLDVSKIESGQLELNWEHFHLMSMMQKIMNLVKTQADAKNLELRLDVENPQDTIHADQRRLEQVLLNLLSNAIKFTESGSVTISCRKSNEFYLISIQDTGIGIPKEHLRMLFQPFRQIDSGLTRKYEGTGLGLSISRSLMRLMHGEITVESQAGIGSTFTITLPIEGGHT